MSGADCGIEVVMFQVKRSAPVHDVVVIGSDPEDGHKLRAAGKNLVEVAGHFHGGQRLVQRE